MLDLPPKPTRQKVELVKTYFSAVLNPHTTFHVATKDTRGSRLGREKSWMLCVKESLLQDLPADRIRANVGKVPKPIPELLLSLIHISEPTRRA